MKMKAPSLSVVNFVLLLLFVIHTHRYHMSILRPPISQLKKERRPTQVKLGGNDAA